MAICPTIDPSCIEYRRPACCTRRPSSVRTCEQMATCRLSGETCAASMWHRLPRSAAEAWVAISGQRSVASAERRMPCSRSPGGWRYAFSLDAANSTWNGIPVSVQTCTSSGWQRRSLQIQALASTGAQYLPAMERIATLRCKRAAEMLLVTRSFFSTRLSRGLGWFTEGCVTGRCARDVIAF